MLGSAQPEEIFKEKITITLGVSNVERSDILLLGVTKTIIPPTTTKKGLITIGQTTATNVGVLAILPETVSMLTKIPILEETRRVLFASIAGRRAIWQGNVL